MDDNFKGQYYKEWVSYINHKFDNEVNINNSNKIIEDYLIGNQLNLNFEALGKLYYKNNCINLIAMLNNTIKLLYDKSILDNEDLEVMQLRKDIFDQLMKYYKKHFTFLQEFPNRIRTKRGYRRITPYNDLLEHLKGILNRQLRAFQRTYINANEKFISYLNPHNYFLDDRLNAEVLSEDFKIITLNKRNNFYKALLLHFVNHMFSNNMQNIVLNDAASRIEYFIIPKRFMKIIRNDLRMLKV